MAKYHIEKNSVQETLVIPLYGRCVCSRRFPALFSDPDVERLCEDLDYDFRTNGAKMESLGGLFGALEAAQRQYDLQWGVEDYLKKHPDAAVVNMGCGLDGTFKRADNGTCRGYNLDMPDVIEVRNELLPPGEREQNIPCDLNDFSWMDAIDASNGAVFIAAGVLYYFKTEQIKALIRAMAARFPGAVLAFDSCNARGAKLMMKTFIKSAGITDVGAYFSLEDPDTVKTWSGDIASVTHRSYMRGYRDIINDVRPFYRMLIRLSDSLVNMRIVKVSF